jgi:hypothetical protein
VSKRQQRAREHAAQVLKAKQAAQARRQRMIWAGTAVAVVLVVFVVLVVVKVSGGGSTATPQAEVTGSAAASVITDVTSVPASVLDSVGTGSVQALPSVTKNQSLLSDGGKPLILYVGAEYCPFCAAERWPVVVALSRFGTFSTLKLTASSSDDTFPSTPTMSFYGATYTSQYLTFQGVETQSNQHSGSGYAQLQQLTADQAKLVQTYNAPPYVSQDSAGSIPFVDFANQAIISGASYSPQLLAGKTQAQVAAEIRDPSSDIAKAVGGTANAITAVICKLTGGQPGNVCTTKAVTAYNGKFDGVASKQ